MGNLYSPEVVAGKTVVNQMPTGAHRWRRHCISTLSSAVSCGPCKGRSHLAPRAFVHPVHPDPARTPLRAHRSPVSCVGTRQLRSQTHLRNTLETTPLSDAVAPAQPGHSVAGRGLGEGALHSRCHHRPPYEIVQGSGDPGSQDVRLFPGLQYRFAHGFLHLMLVVVRAFLWYDFVHVSPFERSLQWDGARRMVPRVLPDFRGLPKWSSFAAR